MSPLGWIRLSSARRIGAARIGRDRLPSQTAQRAALRDDRGFTILEALIATAIVTLLAFTGLAVCKTIAHVMLWSSGTQSDAQTLEAQAAQLQNDAASAFAVFVPASDMFGHPNLGQELDFYSKADDGRPVLWRYVYDASAQTLQRWDDDASGVHGVRDVTTGTIDPAASYPPLKHVMRFNAAAIAADQLGDPARNAYSGIGGLFARPPQALPVRFKGPGLDSFAATGGNGVVQVSLASRATARLIHLAAGSMATGFTVTGVPLWHAIVYRVDQSHRFLLGVAGKSHVFINARVEVSYDNWSTKIPWCDFNLIGAPNGLDAHDPHADYKPDEPIERSENILATCRQLRPLPTQDSPGNPPEADAVHPPLPGQTAPPCWMRPGPGGRCWPADAPSDWVPPEPRPVDTPPPAWCAAHGLSPACRAAVAAPPQGG